MASSNAFYSSLYLPKALSSFIFNSAHSSGSSPLSSASFFILSLAGSYLPFNLTVVVLALVVFASGIFYQILSVPKMSELAVMNEKEIIRLSTGFNSMQKQLDRIEEKLDKVLNRERRVMK